jgi:hypothetical protein
MVNPKIGQKVSGIVPARQLWSKSAVYVWVVIGAICYFVTLLKVADRPAAIIFLFGLPIAAQLLKVMVTVPLLIPWDLSHHPHPVGSLCQL